MDIINQRLTLEQFQDYVSRYDFGPALPDKLVIHHTWKPTREQWQGERSILGLKGYYERKGWTAGPHLFIAEDGIWLFSPMRHNGIHAGQLNHRSIGIEVVGNYDFEKWSGNTKFNTLGAVKALMQRLGIGDSGIFFHRDVSGKTCPGTAITKEWVLGELAFFSSSSGSPGSGLGLPTSGPRVPLVVTTDPNTNTVFLSIPDWAQEAVNFVQQNRLFEIRDMHDVRDAVKFYRFYQLIEFNE